MYIYVYIYIYVYQQTTKLGGVGSSGHKQRVGGAAKHHRLPADRGGCRLDLAPTIWPGVFADYGARGASRASCLPLFCCAARHDRLPAGRGGAQSERDFFVDNLLTSSSG